MVSDRVIKQCQQKDQRAFKSLYEACLPYVFTIVKGYVGDQDLRKDLLQEVFAQVFLHIGAFDQEKGEFRYWLRKVTVNRCLMFVREKRHQWDCENIDAVLPESDLQEQMNLDHLDPDASEQVLSRMPQGYRNVFSLVVLEGYSHDEVGQKLGISAETSRSQLARSKKWLREYLLTNKSLG